jgi:hypothetical protein
MKYRSMSDVLMVFPAFGQRLRSARMRLVESQHIIINKNHLVTVQKDDGNPKMIQALQSHAL